MRTCDTVVNHKLPCVSYGNFKMFKISASEFGTLSMRRQVRACAAELLATGNEGVVQGVYKVVTQPSFIVICDIGRKCMSSHCVRQ